MWGDGRGRDRVGWIYHPRVPVWIRPPGGGGGHVTDPQAEFTSFYPPQFSPVVRTVFLIVNDRGRAEELAQDAFLQLLSHWARVSKYERPDAWVRRGARGGGRAGGGRGGVGG